MRRIESKRGLPGGIRRRNPDELKISNFTPIIELSIISRAEVQAVKDGFPYFRDLVLVLMAAYGNGAISKKLDRDMPRLIQDWASREGQSPAARARDRRTVKRNYKLRKDIYERAEKRWATESNGLTTTAMFAFLLESYAEGEIEFVLRRGKTVETTA